MASELRKTILESEDIISENLLVPEWNVTIEVRGMDGRARAKFLRNTADPTGKSVAWEKYYPELLIATCFDPETHEALFEAADRDALNRKSAAALERVSAVSQRLSGLSGDDVESSKSETEEGS